ncbi:MAG: hypothetical protein N2559_13205, partial [Anaerolineae bacterium]|nr:hypothetical protein [Anaerolineae bacterium]
MNFIRRENVLAALVIAVIVLIAYQRALNVGFYGDDWIFYQLAGRLSLPEYLVKYFDPRVQTAWYRPVQGVLFRIEYILWSGNTVAYHWRNILLHLANCFWVWAIVQRATRDRRFSIFAAIIFAALPLGAQAVFWPGVVDPLFAFFFLAAIFFWLDYLQSAHTRAYAFAFFAFLFALFITEIGVSIPIILFLIDRCIIARPVALKILARRYLAFVLVWLVYLPIEYIVVSRSVFISREGYSPTLNVLSNLFDYLAALAFPWPFVPIVNHIWLVLVGIGLVLLVVWRKKFSLVPMLAGVVLVILPVTPFPFVVHRFLYVASVVPAILYAWVLTQIEARARVLAIAMLGLIVLLGGWRITNDANDFGEWARVARVPFRNVRQAHPTLPAGTYLYFVNPPVPGSNLAGMFFWHYGAHVTIGATDFGQPARLRDYATTFVYIFDEQGAQKELRVEKNLDARADLPVVFGESIVLEGFELVSDRIKHGDALVLLLYWRATQRISDDYTVIVQLVNPDGAVVASYAREPRQGKSPTSAWQPGELIVDAIVLPVQPETPIGTYRIEIGMVDVMMNWLRKQSGQVRV